MSENKVSFVYEFFFSVYLRLLSLVSRIARTKAGIGSYPSIALHRFCNPDDEYTGIECSSNIFAALGCLQPWRGSRRRETMLSRFKGENKTLQANDNISSTISPTSCTVGKFFFLLILPFLPLLHSLRFIADDKNRKNIRNWRLNLYSVWWWNWYSGRTNSVRGPTHAAG